MKLFWTHGAFKDDIFMLGQMIFQCWVAFEYLEALLASVFRIIRMSSLNMPVKILFLDERLTTMSTGMLFGAFLFELFFFWAFCLRTQIFCEINTKSTSLLDSKDRTSRQNEILDFLLKYYILLPFKASTSLLTSVFNPSSSVCFSVSSWRDFGFLPFFFLWTGFFFFAGAFGVALKIFRLVKSIWILILIAIIAKF